ncbi:NAD(P)-binding protein [Athelia psychrophila]|uniref:NAD(P)-binding protein n=1 Tax=Athelia psychrophila TaxID=1759441 RepID=A0A166T086_9AGAM|nr:NAD(P)-binding protein [Fibularhizoctonia sp. CBS 109695]
MAVKGAFAAAMEGVAGVAHVATIMPSQADSALLQDPGLVVAPVVAGTLSVLRTAAATPSVKSVVLTSSSSAAVWPHPDVEVPSVGEDTWNTECLEQAASLPADAPGKEWHIYGASKVRGEQAAWMFYNEEKPGFVFNAILPNINLGPPLLKEDARSTGAWVAQVYNGDISGISAFTPQWFVDVRDTALLHMYALTGASPALAAGGVRMWAVAAPFSGNDILAALRRLYPTKAFLAEIPGLGKELCRIDNKRGGELLGGWRSLDEAVRASVEGM